MAQAINDVQAAKEFLLANPEAIDAFNDKYGLGSANAVLNDTYKTPDELAASIAAREAEKAQPQGFLANAADIVQGVAAGAEAAINETAQTVNSLGNTLEEKLGVGRLVWNDKDGDGKVDLIPEYWSREEVVANADKLKQDAITKFAEELDVVPDAESTAGQVTQSISQFVAGYAGLSRATGIGNGFFKALGKGAVVDATVFDPYEQNLSAFLGQYEWAKPYIIEALKTDPSAPEWENRLRNSIEGGVLGVGTDVVLKLTKFVALGRKAKTEIDSIGKITDDTKSELDDANEELINLTEDINETPKGMIAKADGTFEDVDGKIYRTNGDTLEPVDVSYRMDHQPRGPNDENPIRLDDLTKDVNGAEAGYPEDFYSSEGPRLYAQPPRFDGDDYGMANKQSYQIIKNMRGKPDQEITIFRAVPNDDSITTINSGDFVTLSPKYANLHAASGYGPDGQQAGKVIEQKVKVRDVYWAGDDVNEFGYYPSKIAPETPVKPDAESTPNIPARTKTPDVQTETDTLKQPEQLDYTPKVPLVDKKVFKEAISRVDNKSAFDIRNIDDGGWFNFERMEGPVEAAKVIDEFTNVLNDTGVAKTMKLDRVESHEEVLKDSIKYISENTDTDANKLIKDLNITETVTRDLAQKITAGRMALQFTGREVSKLAGKVDAAAKAGKSSEALDRKLLDAMQLHAELQANVKGIQTAAARATSAGRIATADTDLSNTLDALTMFGGSEKIRKAAKQLKDITDDAARSRHIKKVIERKWIGVLNEYWINQILSGHITHMLNMSSNAINLFLLPAERLAGGLYQGVRSGDYSQAKMALKQYKYLAHSMNESLFLAAKSGYNERPTLDSSMKIDVNGGDKKISAANLGIENRTLGGIVDTIGKTLRLPSRFLLAEDEFFKQIAFRARLKANLEVDADMMSPDDLKNAGYTTKAEYFEGEFKKAVTSQTDALERYEELVLTGKILDDPKVKETFVENAIGGYNKNSEYAVSALREARNTTFTNPLEKGTAGYSIQQMANRHPLLRQIIPFIQTPLNVMGVAWERTPALNLLKQNYKEALRSPDPAIRAEAQGKLATGTAIVGTLTFLAMDGRITGGGPTDPKKSAFWRGSKDWQPYSINVGSHENPNWISTQRLDPHTTLFGIIGDIAEMKAYIESTPDADMTTVYAMTIAAVGNNIVSKTYLQGIADTVGIMTAKDTPWKVDQFFAQKVASLVPFSSLQGQIGRATDEHLLEARGYVDAIKSRTLFMRGDLPIKYDWLTGEAMEGPDTLPFLPHMQRKRLNPKDKNIALVQSEIRKINYAPAGPDRKIGGVELTGEQYHRWNELMGTVKLGNKTLVERLAKKIESKRYKSYADNHGEFTVAEDPRVDELKVIISDYKTRAKKLLQREFPELRNAIREYERYKKLAKGGREGERPVLDMNLR